MKIVEIIEVAIKVYKNHTDCTSLMAIKATDWFQVTTMNNREIVSFK